MQGLAWLTREVDAGREPLEKRDERWAAPRSPIPAPAQRYLDEHVSK